MHVLIGAGLVFTVVGLIATILGAPPYVGLPLNVIGLILCVCGLVGQLHRRH